MNWTDEERAEVTDLGATEYGALVRDARRYRWPREQQCDQVTAAGWEVSLWTEEGFGTAMRLEAIDAAIDAAMEAANE
ncbi:MAG TPA: hypothetical protein VIN36_10420 [Thiobacillus sp.]